jgi:hypothetical protein
MRVGSLGCNRSYAVALLRDIIVALLGLLFGSTSCAASVLCPAPPTWRTSTIVNTTSCVRVNRYVEHTEVRPGRPGQRSGSCAVIAAFDLSERGQALFAEQQINSTAELLLDRCLTVDGDHAELLDRSLVIPPCDHRLACPPGGTAARRDPLRHRLDLRRSLRCASKREAG